MANQLLVVHERLGTWARNLRARLSDWPLRLVETRSAADLEQALAGVSCPLVLIDAGTSPRRLIDDLDLTLRQAPDALTLVIDRSEHKGLPLLARQIGATHVFSGPVSPPAVAGFLTRWIPLARKRAEFAGWSRTAPRLQEPEPWDLLFPQPDERPAEPRSSRVQA